MAAPRARSAKPDPGTSETPEDGVPSFTTEQDKAVFNGPVLMRIDGTAYRMRGDESFAASLRYVRLARGQGLRVAELALIDYVAGAEATDKLLQVAKLNPAKWQQVVKRAGDHVLGRNLEDEEGN